MVTNLFSFYLALIAQPIIPRAAKSILDAALNYSRGTSEWSSFDGWANGLPVGLSKISRRPGCSSFRRDPSK